MALTASPKAGSSVSPRIFSSEADAEQHAGLRRTAVVAQRAEHRGRIERRACDSHTVGIVNRASDNGVGDLVAGVLEPGDIVGRAVRRIARDQRIVDLDGPSDGSLLQSRAVSDRHRRVAGNRTADDHRLARLGRRAVDHDTAALSGMVAADRRIDDHQVAVFADVDTAAV